MSSELRRDFDGSWYLDGTINFYWAWIFKRFWVNIKIFQDQISFAQLSKTSLHIYPIFDFKRRQISWGWLKSQWKMCKTYIEIVKRREEKDQIRISSYIWWAQHNENQSVLSKIQKFDRLIFLGNFSTIIVES